MVGVRRRGYVVVFALARASGGVLSVGSSVDVGGSARCGSHVGRASIVGRLKGKVVEERVGRRRSLRWHLEVPLDLECGVSIS